jgi:hypothetical protein
MLVCAWSCVSLCSFLVCVFCTLFVFDLIYAFYFQKKKKNSAKPRIIMGQAACRAPHIPENIAAPREIGEGTRAGGGAVH